MKKLIYLIVVIGVLALIVAGCGIPVVPPTEQNEPGTLSNKSPDLYVPSVYPTIQAAITAASPGDTIIVAAGTYNVNSTLALNKADLVLKGEAGSKPKITTSGSNYLFNISAPGVTVENFEIEKTDTLNQNIIYIGADNVTIKDNLIHGQFVMGNAQVERAMEITYALTGLNIDGNTIHSLRQPAYINASTGVISNNDVYNTKGWVILSQSNLTFTNNTWGDGTLPNYYDVAIIKDSPEGANNYPDIVTMSEENNNAIIENQHSTYSPAILSIVHVDAITSGSLNGSILDPYADISSAIPRVALGGTVHVAAGTYTEHVRITKSLTLQGAGASQTAIDVSGLGIQNPHISVEVQNGVNNVVVDGFTIIGVPAEHHSDDSVIRCGGSSGTNSDITISNNVINGYKGILFKNGDSLKVQKNVITFNKNAIVIQYGCANIDISDNTMTGGTSMDSDPYGIYMTSTTGSITGNTIQDVIGPIDDRGKGIGGSNNHDLLIDDNVINNTGYDGISFWSNTHHVTISNNTLSNNAQTYTEGGGITIKGDDITIINNNVTGSGHDGVIIDTHVLTSVRININYNNISGNVDYGVNVKNAGDTVDAIYNWWGHASGPSGEYGRVNNQGKVIGKGDSVSDNVDWDPWLPQPVGHTPQHPVPPGLVK